MNKKVIKAKIIKAYYGVDNVEQMSMGLFLVYQTSKDDYHQYSDCGFIDNNIFFKNENIENRIQKLGEIALRYSTILLGLPNRSLETIKNNIVRLHFEDNKLVLIKPLDNDELSRYIDLDKLNE